MIFTSNTGNMAGRSIREELQKALMGHHTLQHAILVDHAGELPTQIQSALLKDGLDASKVCGAHDDNGIYLVCSNIADVEAGIKVALHEAVGHQGLRAVLGEEFDRTMFDLYWSFPREHAAWQTTIERYAHIETESALGQIALAEELCAYVAESGEELDTLAMVQAEIRIQIRQEFPDLPMEELDVRALIQRSRESLILRHGDPEEIDEVHKSQKRRSHAARLVVDSWKRNGRLHLTERTLGLWREGSRVLDDKGVPCRLYHGGGKNIDFSDTFVGRSFWGSVDPQLANQYAELRQDHGWPSRVIPFNANIQRPFDGDRLKEYPSSEKYPYGLTIGAFIRELKYQSEHDHSRLSELDQLAVELRILARREESGPSYSPKDFWHQTSSMFGLEGQRLLQKAFAVAGFDGIRFTEQNTLTYGVFDAKQVLLMDMPSAHDDPGCKTQREMDSPYVPSPRRTQFSFAGKNARSADHLTLDYAQQAMAGGIDPELIRQQCGWHRALDGQWRFELDDSQCTLKAPFPQKNQRWGDIHESEYPRSLSDHGTGITLGRLLDHPALFEAYPQLADITVGCEPGGSCAFRQPGGGEPASIIMGAETVMSDLLSPLMHEIQHGVQHLEGFARGGSATQGRVSPVVWRAALEDMERRYGHLPSFHNKAVERASGRLDRDNYEQWVIGWAETVEADGVGGLMKQHYQRLAGEAEARNVQNRLGMSAVDRSITSPFATQDIGADQLILNPHGASGTGGHAVPLLESLGPSTLDFASTEVINHTEAGRQLQALASNTRHLLEDAGHDCGWMDGGCRIFAEALCRWSESAIDLGAVSTTEDHMSHAVGVITHTGTGEQTLILLDADGISSEATMSHKLAAFESASGHRLVATGADAQRMATVATLDSGLVRQLSHEMTLGLGAYPDWRQRLNEQLGIQKGPEMLNEHRPADAPSTVTPGMSPAL